MACDKIKVSCDKCEYINTQDRCPGANFWNELCGLELVSEDKILTKPIKKTFGRLFTSLQNFIPTYNFQLLSSNKVSTLKRSEIITLLKEIRKNEKELVPPDYVNLNNDNISKLLYKIMILIHERRN